MNYTIALSEEAQAKLSQLPADVVALLPDHFARLAAHPVTLSIPGAPPASLPDRQIYAFPADFSDDRETALDRSGLASARGLGPIVLDRVSRLLSSANPATIRCLKIVIAGVSARPSHTPLPL